MKTNKEKRTNRQKELEQAQRYLREFGNKRMKRSRTDWRILEGITGRIWRRTKWQELRIIIGWSWKLRTKKSSEMMASRWSREKATPEMHRMIEKNFHDWNNLIGWHRASTANLRESGQDLRETLLRSSKLRMTTRNTTKNCWDTPEEWKAREVDPTMKRIWKRSWRRHVTDGIHSYVTLEKNLRITPEELKESGKIVGKGKTKATWKGGINE